MRVATAQQVEAEWLRYPEAEKYAGLGRSTLFGLVQSGQIQAAKVGKAVRLSRSSIDEYMERQAYSGVEE
jgi:excisionase family DNA binding protein